MTADKNSTVAKMLSAAEALFVARAYSDVTIDQVAAAANVTKGAVYHHFSSKKHLYTTMLKQDLDQKRRTHQRALDLDGSCQERLRMLLENFLSLPETKRNLIGLVRRDVNIFDAETRDGLIQAYQEALPDLVEAIISDGIGTQEIKDCDPRLLAWHFVALVEVILTPYAQQQLTNDESKIGHVMGLFLGGCAQASLEKQL